MKRMIPLSLILPAALQAQAGQTLSEEQLGELLFLDPSFSVNRSMSCSTCHDQIGRAHV